MPLNKSVVSLFLFLFLLSFAVTATYESLGTRDADFILDTGFFNAGLDLTEVSPATRAITGNRTPLISDLDGDGQNEIIVLDATTIRLYHGKDLTIVDAINLNNSGPYSNFEIYDIDSDGYREIIYADDKEQQINFLQYNGSKFIVDKTFTFKDEPNSNDGETLIKCGSGGYCLLVYINEDTSLGGSVRDYVSGVSFSASGLGNYTAIAQTGATPPQVFCFPKIRTMQFVDYDQDGEKEYVFGMVWGHTTAAEAYLVYQVRLNSTGFPVSTSLIAGETSGNLVDAGSLICSTHDLGRYFTNALTFDIDGSLSNGLETVFGMMEDSDEFRMFSYDASATFIDDYPEVFQADGVLVSNIFRANVFTDTDNDDFCVLGYDDEGQQIDLLCASEKTGSIPESKEFPFSTAGLENMTQQYGFQNVIAHAGQHSSATTDGNNLHEIISTYGVFTIDYSFANELLRAYESPVYDAALIADDVEGVGRDDLIAISKTNIWYIDDGYTKVPGEIDAYTINPCIDQTWADNGTAEITITAVDADSDNVAARAILYYGDANEQDSGWSVNASSGTSFPFNFVVNKTIGTGTIKLMARDDDMPGQEDIINLSFSVGADGVVLDDCITSVDVTTSIEEAAEEAAGGPSDPNEPDLDNSTLTDMIDGMNETSGLNMGRTAFWLLIMVFAAVGMWIYGAKNNWNTATMGGVIGLLELGLFIIGAIMDYISAALVIILIVIAIGALAYIMGKKVTGG